MKSLKSIIISTILGVSLGLSLATNSNAIECYDACCCSPKADNYNACMDICTGKWENTENNKTFKLYRVEKGDNLTKVSKEYNVNIKDIIDCNNISNPNLIFPDQLLLIPN